MKLKWCIGLLSVIFTSAALAQDARGFYVGAALGASEYDDDGYFDQQRLDDSEVGGKVYGGYRFNSYVSVETALVGLGNFESKTSDSEVKNEFGVWSFSALGQLPLAYGMALFGELGFGFSSIYQDYAYVSPSAELVTGDDDDVDMAGIYGAGLLIIPPDFNKLELRAGWTRYVFSADTVRVDNGIKNGSEVDHEFDLFYAGIALNFW